jgi:hypothetical protein
MIDLKQGDKFLLPVEIEVDTNDHGWTWVLTEGYRSQTLTSDEAKTLIPADRLTDLEAENAKLRSALKAIKHMLEVPNHRDITPEMIYRAASKALDGDAK